MNSLVDVVNAEGLKYLSFNHMSDPRFSHDLSRMRQLSLLSQSSSAPKRGCHSERKGLTGMETAAIISRIILGSLIRATPPSRLISDGTRSSACNHHTHARVSSFLISSHPSWSSKMKSEVNKECTHHDGARTGCFGQPGFIRVDNVHYNHETGLAEFISLFTEVSVCLSFFFQRRQECSRSRRIVVRVGWCGGEEDRMDGWMDGRGMEGERTDNSSFEHLSKSTLFTPMRISTVIAPTSHCPSHRSSSHRTVFQEKRRSNLVLELVRKGREACTAYLESESSITECIVIQSWCCDLSGYDGSGSIDRLRCHCCLIRCGGSSGGRTRYCGSGE